MSRVIVGRDYHLLPTSETLSRRSGDGHPAGDPPAEVTPSPPAVHASAQSGSGDDGSDDSHGRATDLGPAVTVVAAPMLAPTVHQPAMQAPASDATPIPSGARLIRLSSGEVLAIRDATALIGRDRDCDLVVSEPAVSRRHGIVRRSVRGYVLTDVSRNGTYVNGRRVRGARLLRTGDVVRIGKEEFRFELSRAACPTGVALPAALTRPLAHLWRGLAVARARIARRIAASRRVRIGPVLGHLRRARRLAWIGLWRALAAIRARSVSVWRVVSRQS